MPRNGSGNYSLPEAPFVPNTAILSAEVNADLDDIASALTGSVASDGQTPISGPIQFFSGSLAAPGMSWAVDPDTGWYRSAVGTMVGVSNGAAIVTISPSGISITGTLDVTGDLAFTGNITISGTLDVAGNFSVATNKFTVDAATGNTAIAGDAAITGALAVTGAQTFTGIATFANVNDMVLPGGTTAQRPGTPTALRFRGNTDIGLPEYDDGVLWRSLSAAQPVPAGFKNLTIQNNSGTPNTQVDITADAVTMETAGGVAYRATTVSVTINCATTGANGLDAGSLANSTFYSMWVIYNPATNTVAGLASLSATAPTMPSGYTAKVRLGWLLTDGSAHFYRSIQKGRTASIIVGTNPAAVAAPFIVASGVTGTYSGTNPILASKSIAGAAPSTASEILLNVYSNWKGGALSSFLVAPNTAWGGTNNGPIGSAGNVWQFALDSGSAAGGMNGWMPLEATTIGVAMSNTGGVVAVLGWRDNI